MAVAAAGVSSSSSSSSSSSYSKLTSNELLAKLVGKSGVYFISQDPVPEDENDMMLVKIGIGLNKVGGSNISRRLQSYLLYWPRGFNVFGIVLTSASAAKKLEQSIHAYLKNKNRKMDPTDYKHSHIEEWFYLTPREVHKLIQYDKDSNPIEFNPVHYLVENPTAGKQRKVKPLTPEEQEEFEKRDSTITPVRTANTEMKKRSKSRLMLEYDHKIHAADDQTAGVTETDAHDEEYDDRNVFETPRNLSSRQQRSHERKATYARAAAAAADNSDGDAGSDGNFQYVYPIINGDDDMFEQLYKPSNDTYQTPKKRQITEGWTTFGPLRPRTRSQSGRRRRGILKTPARKVSTKKHKKEL